MRWRQIGELGPRLQRTASPPAAISRGRRESERIKREAVSLVALTLPATAQSSTTLFSTEGRSTSRACVCAAPRTWSWLTAARVRSPAFSLSYSRPAAQHAAAADGKGGVPTVLGSLHRGLAAIAGRSRLAAAEPRVHEAASGVPAYLFIKTKVHDPDQYAK